MKYFLFAAIVLCGLFAFTTGHDTIASKLTDEQKAKIAENRKKCKEEVGTVDQQLIDDAKHGKFADDAQLKKYFACLAEKSDFITKDNQINVDILKRKTGGVLGDQNKADQLTDKCIKFKKDNYVDSVYAIVVCFFENANVTLL